MINEKRAMSMFVACGTARNKRTSGGRSFTRPRIVLCAVVILMGPDILHETFIVVLAHTNVHLYHMVRCMNCANAERIKQVQITVGPSISGSERSRAKFTTHFDGW